MTPTYTHARLPFFAHLQCNEISGRLKLKSIFRLPLLKFLSRKKKKGRNLNRLTLIYRRELICMRITMPSRVGKKTKQISFVSSKRWKKIFGYSPCGTHPWWHLSQYRMCLFPGVNESHEHPFTVHLIDWNRAQETIITGPGLNVSSDIVRSSLRNITFL